MKLADKEAKYGYVITCTPGLIDEGNCVLSSDGIKRGEIEPASFLPIDENPAAVFATRECATSAMLSLSERPAVDGLGIESAYDRAFDYLFDDLVEGMSGFVIPDVRD